MPSAVVDDTIAAMESPSSPSEPPNTPKPTLVSSPLGVAGPSQPPADQQIPADASMNNFQGEAAIDIGIDDAASSDIQNRDAPELPDLPAVGETVAATETCSRLLRDLNTSVEEEDITDVGDSLSPSVPSNPRPGSVVDWRVRARNVSDWTSQQSIKEHFPLYDKKRYGQLQVPLSMISQYGSCYQKAKAVAYFRRLTHLQQKELTKYYRELAAQEKKARKAQKKLEDTFLRDRRRRLKKEQQAAKKAADKAEKRAQREAEKPERDAARKAKKKTRNDKRKRSDETKMPAMSSVLLNNEAAVVANSASAAQLVNNQLKKQRVRYSLPTKASHLSDKAARDSEKLLYNQMFSSSRSITPPPGAENWAYKNYFLASLSTTRINERMARTKKNANKLTTEGNAAAKMSLTLTAGHGGSPEFRRFISQCLATGKFDDEVSERFRNISSQTEPNICVQSIHSKEQYTTITQSHASKRKVAEKSRSTSDIAADPNIGAKAIDMATLHSRFAKYTNAGRK